MQESEDEEKKEKQSRSRSWLIGGIIVLLIWIVFGWIVPVWIGGRWDGAGTFGDSFGMVNSLFSGFAFLGVVIAIWLQSRELRLQLREFSNQTRLQQDTLKQQKDANAAQVELMREQMEATKEQIELLKSERAIREQERSLAIKPILTLEFVSIDENDAELILHNGGGPVFNPTIRADSSISFIHPTLKTEVKTIPILSREKPSEIVVRSVGFNSVKFGRNFPMTVTRSDHKTEEYRLSWGPINGLSEEKFPSTSVNLE